MAARRRPAHRARAPASPGRPLPPPRQPAAPQQGIGDLTPAERYTPPAPTAQPVGELTLAEQQDPLYPQGSIIRKLWSTGLVSYQAIGITLGKRRAEAHVRIVPNGQLVHIYYGNQLLRTVALDRRKRYQTLRTRRRRKAVTAADPH